MSPKVLPSIKVTDPSQATQSHHSLESALSPEGSSSFISKSYSSDGTNNSYKASSKQSPVRLRNAPLLNKSGIMSRAISPTTPPPATNANTERLNATIDPLSHHILKRTNTESAIAQKFKPIDRSENIYLDESIGDSIDGTTSNRIDYSRGSDAILINNKKKNTSFLSRFSISGAKKRENELVDDDDDDESEHGDLRPEGMNAHVFSTSVDANGYIPQHKEPPRYIKVRKHNKKQKEFNRMFLAQELKGNKSLKRRNSNEKITSVATSDLTNNGKKVAPNAIWATEFSRDGKHLAAAGQDGIVRVWAVLSSKEEREAHEDDEDARSGKAERLSAPVFASRPVREFEGHTGTVLDLSWSKNNFLLSSSMDKTVRLWHISREECLCTFKHKDFVTSIAFHPRDDRFFLAGSLDSVLRLWSIPDKSVAYWSTLPDLITAVAFSPDGLTCIAGLLSGQCLFYETDNLKLQTQIHVRSSRGKNAKGSKITGIRCCIYPHNDLNGDTKVLITTNDSRIRLYNLNDKTLELKFRGHENSCSQIRASISDDTKFIICGSEDRKAYIWSLGADKDATIEKEKRPVEIFEAHSDMVTTTTIAPLQTRQLLSQSGDPIYDLCNPPPVMLLSRAESNVSSRVPTLPETADKRISVADTLSVAESTSKRPQESPGYVLRSRHEDGNIIVTADHSGIIKVFRQDCAYQKRRNDNTWDSQSAFSRRRSGLGRSGSMASSIRKQSGTHSRRGSVVHRDSTLHEEGERILSWRSGIDGTVHSLNPSLRSYDRSISPSNFAGQPARTVTTPPLARPIPDVTQFRTSSMTSSVSNTSRLSHVSFQHPETPPQQQRTRAEPEPERTAVRTGMAPSRASNRTTPKARGMGQTPAEQPQRVPTPGFQFLRNEEGRDTPQSGEGGTMLGKSWLRWGSAMRKDKELATGSTREDE